MKRFLKRLKEPSTYAGIAGLAVSAGHFVGKPQVGEEVAQVVDVVAEPAAHGDWLHVLIAICSAIAVLGKEGRDQS